MKHTKLPKLYPQVPEPALKKPQNNLQDKWTSPAPPYGFCEGFNQFGENPYITNTAEKQQKNQVFDFMIYWAVRTLRCDPHPHPKTPRGSHPKSNLIKICPVFCPVKFIESSQVVEILAKSIIKWPYYRWHLESNQVRLARAT